MQEVILKISLLIEAAREDLKKQLVLTSTVERYSQRWEMLSDYMSTLEIKNYNRKVGHNYLEHLFGHFSFSKLSKHEKVIVRKVEYLTQFQEKGSVLRKRKKPETNFGGRIGKAIESFILRRQETGYSESTMKYYKLYLRAFLTSMHQQKIDDPDSIKAPHIIAFVESQKGKSLTTQYCLFGVAKGFLKYLHSIDPATN
jgi:hypothetical protein